MEKLYYRQPYVKAFEAVVTDCREGKNGRYQVMLDRTGFYPEGGGQPGDTWMSMKRQERSSMRRTDPWRQGRPLREPSTGKDGLDTCRTIQANIYFQDWYIKSMGSIMWDFIWEARR